MTVCFARGFGAALIYAVATQAAYADLTAQDVWSDWKSYLGSAGYSVEGDEQTSGGVLTISNMSVSMPIPEGDGNFSVDLDTLIFTENGDGTVSIAMPDSIPMTFEGSVEGEDPVSGTVLYTHSNTAMIATGTPAEMLYTYTAAKVDLALSSLSVDGETVPSSVVGVSFTMNNVATSTQMQIGGMRSYSQRMSADSLNYNIAFDDPESDDHGTFTGAIQGLGFDGTGAIPLNIDPADFNKMLADGFAVDGAFTYTSGNSNMQGVGDGQSINFNSSSQGGRIAVKIDASQIGYDLEQKQTSLSMEGGELPFPIAMDAALSAFNIAIPVAKSDAEQDFAIGMTLSDFTMSDMLWSLFDPAAQLPRDPATIALDLTGKAKVLFNFLDPVVAATLEQNGESPVELNALTINNLLVSLVGASLSGTGDFTFDNSDTETFDGMPRPIGYVDLKLVGANALLDKLISMGFVADEEAMGARMMMGMLAVPGDEPDTLKSKLEINDQGHVLANGQRIQ